MTARERERSAHVLGVTVITIGGLAIAHDLLALALDRLGLVERLLSPSGLDVALALAAGLALFALRLALLVLAPAVVLGLVGAWLTTVALAPTRASRTQPLPTERSPSAGPAAP